MTQKKYDSTVARIAGNIAGHCLRDFEASDQGQAADIAKFSVSVARAIIAEVERTEPPSPEAPRP